MSIIADVEEKALSLPGPERGRLASKLIASLGSPFDNSDEEVIELALQRDGEMDVRPDTAMSEEDFWASIDEYRPK